jgi:hypothetical protein
MDALLSVEAAWTCVGCAAAFSAECWKLRRVQKTISTTTGMSNQGQIA